jgi:hypothetical protein
MKKTWFAFFVFGLCVLSLAFLYGCETGPTSSSISTDSTNKGTISGHAYICNYYGGTYTGTPDVTISVNPSTTTDANGAYTLSGLTPGKVTITAIKAGCKAKTFVIDRSTVDFVVTDLATIEPATIKGTIEGVTPGNTIYLKVYSRSADTALNEYYGGILYQADPTTMTYEVRGLPGFTCVRASCGSGHAYNATTTSPGGISYMNISFEAGVTIDATAISVPSGYTATYMYAVVSRDNFRLVRVCDSKDISGTSCKLEDVAPLKAGYSYVVTIVSTNDACTYYKRYYGRSAGSQTFNDTSVLPSTLLVNPSGSTFTTASMPSTIEWSSVGEDYYYRVYISQGGPPATRFEWEIFTFNTSIEVPASIASMIPAGTNYIDIQAQKYHTPPQGGDFDDIYANEPDNYSESSFYLGN